MANEIARTEKGGMVPFGTSAQTFADLVRENKPALKQIAAESIDLSRLYRVIVGCVATTPGLQRCSVSSIMRCMQQAAEVGLEPGGALGLAYLVPFNNSKTGGSDCQFIIGYRGFIELARRSGFVRTVEAYAVYEGDVWEYEQGLKPVLRHIPGTAERDPSKLTHVYAVARYKDGSSQADVMTRQDVERIRTRSNAGQSGPWKTDYEEMAKKTAVRRLCKYLPRSIQLERGFVQETRNEMSDTPDIPLTLVSADDEFDNPLDADITEEPSSVSRQTMAAITG